MKRYRIHVGDIEDAYADDYNRTELPDGEWVRFADLPQWSSDLEACPYTDAVLLYDPSKDGGEEFVVGFKREDGTYGDHIEYGFVFPTHWMPLPEGPK